MTVFLGANVVLLVCSFSKHDFDWLHFRDSRLSGTQETQQLWEVQSSLVPWPFPPLVFDCLQYARMYGMYFVSKFNGLNSMQKTEITESVTDPRSVY